MGPPKKLLVSREQLIEIEKRYRVLLPLPNPDVHEVIAQELEMEPSKVFFGINLVRAKMKLPKLDYPKRKLAVTPDQMMAVEALYTPFLPTPPLGIHKIISKQLKMDEWRVHVAIGLIRKSKDMPRWNEDRPDLPDSVKEALEAARKVQLEDASAASSGEGPGKASGDEAPEAAEAKPEEKPKRKAASSKKATAAAQEPADEA